MVALVILSEFEWDRNVSIIFRASVIPIVLSLGDILALIMSGYLYQNSPHFICFMVHTCSENDLSCHISI